MGTTANVGQDEQMAINAQKQVQGHLMVGRPLRTEIAHARSIGFLYRLDGGDIDPGDLPSVFGRISIRETWSPSDSDVAVHNLPPRGLFVDFHDHGPYTKALKVCHPTSSATLADVVFRSWVTPRSITSALRLTTQRAGFRCAKMAMATCSNIC